MSGATYLVEITVPLGERLPTVGELSSALGSALNGAYQTRVVDWPGNPSTRPREVGES